MSAAPRSAQGRLLSRRTRAFVAVVAFATVLGVDLAQAQVIPPADIPATPPRLISGSCVRPEYPFASIRAKESGVTLVDLDVDVHGTVTRSDVAQSSGSRHLDDAAVLAFRGCRFHPALDAAGQAMATWTKLRFDWRLEDIPPDPWVDLRARNGAGFQPTADFSVLPFAGNSVTTKEQRAKILEAVQAQATTNAQCASIESVSSRIVQDGSPLPATLKSRSLEVWSLTQCGVTMRYGLAIFFPVNRRPYFRMEPFLTSKPDPAPFGPSAAGPSETAAG
jgi:TonB family protein